MRNRWNPNAHHSLNTVERVISDILRTVDKHGVAVEKSAIRSVCAWRGMNEMAIRRIIRHIHRARQRSARRHHEEDLAE